ncbi:MAG: aminoacyl-tRNA hydrolase [Mangrovibacterium sp.]
MKYLIVGLGNPGKEYENTRHNIGFKILDALAGASNISFRDARHGWVAEYKFKGRTLILVKPTTYMNLSGKAVRYWMQEEKIPLENVLVLVDDLALPFASLRLKGKGSDAGHNGLKSIQENLGGNNYARLRFGIGDDFSRGRQVDYVLGEWSKDETLDLPLKLDECINIIHSFVSVGLSQTMNQFNKRK